EARADDDTAQGGGGCRWERVGAAARRCQHARGAVVREARAETQVARMIKWVSISRDNARAFAAKRQVYVGISARRRNGGVVTRRRIANIQVVDRIRYCSEERDKPTI